MTYATSQLQSSLFSAPDYENSNTGADNPPAKALRPYQAEAIRSVYRHIGAGTKRVCLVAPTGAGKTILSATIVSDAVGRGRRVAFCVPAISLINQTVEVFEGQGLGPIGVIQADHPRVDPSAPIQVCSVQTLARRGSPEGVDVVLVDEAHVEAKAIRDWMAAQPDTVFVGMTATPGRGRMRDEYAALVVSTDIGELIQRGYLSRYRVFAPSAPDLSKARKVAGDFHKGDAAEAMGDAKLTADIVQTWLEKGEDRPTLLFAVDRAHAARLQQEFEAVGVACGYQDAHTDPIERAFIAREFAQGRMRIVANVGTLTTGVDWDVRCLILARPTQSKMLHVQIIGRGLRTADGKADCVILDHAGNMTRVGFPEDIDWSSFPQPGEKKAPAERKEPMPKPCSKCSYVMAPKVKECPACGHEAGPPSGFIETEDGELVELGRDGEPAKPKAREFTKEEKQVWWSGIIHEQRRLKKHPGWAAHTYRDKFGVWPRGLDDTPATPLPAVLGHIRSKQIRFAKSKGGAK